MTERFTLLSRRSAAAAWASYGSARDEETGQIVALKAIARDPPTADDPDYRGPLSSASWNWLEAHSSRRTLSAFSGFGMRDAHAHISYWST
jgi:hypothetical protein